ncbi:MAG: sulfotransferase domain-containing protein [Pseudomonadales bacterium]
MILSVDRLQHWSYLALTAVLPHNLRVKSRLTLLRNLQRRMLQRADIVFIRHPKTGGTWVRAMLTHLYAARDGISQKRVFKSDELQRQNPKLPRYLITNGYASWEHMVADAYASRDPILAGKKTLFLARHPGDIAVSWHRQYRKRTKAFKRELLEYEMGTKVDWQNMDRWEFIQRPELGLPSLISYQNFWAEQLAGRDDALILRYEDLRRDTEAELARIVEFLGESFTPEQISAAVAFGSVDNMRTLEHSGYFQNSSLRLRDANDPDTFKVRRAKPGGYRDDLTSEQADWVEAQVREHSHPALGYADGSAAAARQA